MVEKRYLIDNKELMQEWDWEENSKNNIVPDNKTIGSSIRVYWICKKCHNKWQTSIKNRASKSKSTGCPKCARKITNDARVQSNLKRKGSLQKTNPELLDFWNYDENQKLDIFPNSITSGSHYNVYWKCEKGHVYMRTIREEVKNRKCPICNNKKLLSGFNDVETLYPTLCSFFNKEKNNQKLSQILCNNYKKYWWKYSCGHEIYNTIDFMLNNSSCPICATVKIIKEHKPRKEIKSSKIITGVNDFATCHPNLLNEWDYKNNNLDPNKIGEFSNKKVNWICSRCGYEFQQIVSRRSKGSGCPKCNSEKNTSFGEQILFYYLTKSNVDCINRYKLDSKYEIDIYIDSLKVGIEYDGFYFHKNKIEKDLLKEKYINSKGIELYRIIEKKDNEIVKISDNDNKYVYNARDYETYNKIIEDLFRKLGISHQEINIIKDYSEINKSYQKSLKDKSLDKISKNFLIDYNYEKNYPILPENLYNNSSKKIWWKCHICSTEYFRSPNERNAGCGCPNCGHKKRVKTLEKVLLDKNGSLKEKKPVYLEEWNFKKNTLLPDEITLKSNKKVWWKCKKCNHEWESTPYNRYQGKGCPKCALKKIGEKKAVKVNQYDKNGKYIQTFNSITEARKKTGATKIIEVCKKRRKTSGGYIWKYLDSD